MDGTMKGRAPLRGVAGLVLAMVALSAVALTPAVAATFTKKKADKRFLGNTAVASTTTTMAGGAGGTVTVLCPSGRQAVGGGVSTPGFIANNSGPFNGILTLERKPLMSGGRSVGWVVEVINAGSNPLAVTGHAICTP